MTSEEEANRRTISDQGVAFIGQWEGFRDHLYNDPTGNCTIGYGHLVHYGRCNGSEPPNYRNGISRREALALLRRDADFASRGVDGYVLVSLNQHQFDALCSFAYNVGVGAFGGSTLLRKLNRGDYESVPSELMRWTNGGLPGLVRRRAAEGDLFRHGHMTDEEPDSAATDEVDPSQVANAPIAEGEPTVSEATKGHDE